MRQCLKAFGEAAGEIGFTNRWATTPRPGAAVIDAIVTCWTDAMVAHHEPASTPGAGMPPRRSLDPMPPIRSPDLEDDLPWGRTEGEKP